MLPPTNRCTSKILVELCVPTKGKPAFDNVYHKEYLHTELFCFSGYGGREEEFYGMQTQDNEG